MPNYPDEGLAPFGELPVPQSKLDAQPTYPLPPFQQQLVVVTADNHRIILARTLMSGPATKGGGLDHVNVFSTYNDSTLPNGWHLLVLNEFAIDSRVMISYFNPETQTTRRFTSEKIDQLTVERAPRVN
jgi:hypothetical protein